MESLASAHPPDQVDAAAQPYVDHDALDEAELVALYNAALDEADALHCQPMQPRSTNMDMHLPEAAAPLPQANDDECPELEAPPCNGGGAEDSTALVETTAPPLRTALSAQGSTGGHRLVIAAEFWSYYCEHYPEVATEAFDEKFLGKVHTMNVAVPAAVSTSFLAGVPGPHCALDSQVG